MTITREQAIKFLYAYINGARALLPTSKNFQNSLGFWRHLEPEEDMGAAYESLIITADKALKALGVTEEEIKNAIDWID